MTYDKASYERNKAAHHAWTRRWRQEHPEAERAIQARARAKNHDKHIAAMRSWRQRHPEHRAKYMRDWYRANPEKAKAAFKLMWLRRRGRIRTAGEHTYNEWLALLEEYSFRCAYCLRGDLALVPDHVVPVARGGTNLIDNIVPACGPCNRRKSATPLIVFMARRAQAA